MYPFISFASFIIRQFLLPNPFEPLGETFTLTINEISFLLSPASVNFFVEPILHVFTFLITGIYYQKESDNPACGSFVYLLFYCIHSFLIYAMSWFGFTKAAVIIVLSCYILLHFLVNRIRSEI